MSTTNLPIARPDPLEVPAAEAPVAPAAPAAAPSGEISPDALRAILNDISFSDDQVAAVRALAPQITDKAGAAKVIVETIAFSDSKAKALQALTGQKTQRTNDVIQSPTFSDRLAGLVYGAAKPVRNFVPTCITAVVGAIAFGLVGVDLNHIPVLNFLAEASGIGGFGGAFLSAFVGTAGAFAITGAVNGFAQPRRAGANAAAVGANVGSQS